MPDSTVEAAPESAPKRRGRKPGTGTRKRHDGDAAPISGFRSLDQVVGQRKGMRYAALTEDAAEMKGEDGYRKVPWTATGPRFRWGTSNTKRGLSLYEIREADHAAAHREQIAISDQRMGNIDAKAKATGGENTSRVST